MEYLEVILTEWTSNDGIDTAFKALQGLRERKKNIYFITNNSTRSKAEIAEKFKTFGVEVPLNEIYTSTQIAGMYLLKNHPNLKKILMIGTESMKRELSNFGYEIKTLEQPPVEDYRNVKSLLKEVDLSVQALLVGFDAGFTYQKMSLLSIYLQKGIPFFATNPDLFTMSGGYKVPGNGSIIKAIEAASQIHSINTGKPNPFILEEIIKKEKLNKEECIMIGDSLQTDIQFGLNAGIATLCVLTGITKEEEIKNEINPHYFSDHL